ncbi:hypothetical protein D7294_18955 [Streptomyces hoynatensis]|uniref:Secreted protein n=1 Tax=Streptomyces hoynatensis TaxID=1141874 RepID=A0A3A9YWW5_9ACTN|nr:hypothetical protein D7294_18955 [Streptomyces hoynatensis]
MRNALGWVAATCLAAGVAWLGVRGVLGPPENAPQAVSLPGPGADAGLPEASSTRRPPQGPGGQTVATVGGEAVFDLGPVTARLLSATPARGWEVDVAQDERRIRVRFTQDGQSVTVVCSFAQPPPTIRTYR